jgi:hypothetical protein
VFLCREYSDGNTTIFSTFITFIILKLLENIVHEKTVYHGQPIALDSYCKSHIEANPDQALILLSFFAGLLMC